MEIHNLNNLLRDLPLGAHIRNRFLLHLILLCSNKAVMEKSTSPYLITVQSKYINRQ